MKTNFKQKRITKKQTDYIFKFSTRKVLIFSQIMLLLFPLIIMVYYSYSNIEKSIVENITPIKPLLQKVNS